MVFQNNFVAVVVCNGQILREHDDVVTLPFGSDYSLKLKNMESRKASVLVSIDGTDVLNGSRLIMPPNSKTVLDGFLDGHDVRNRFRFIQKTKEIIEHRGDKLDDGIVRVEYHFEKRKDEFTYHYNTTLYPSWPIYRPYCPPPNPWVIQCGGTSEWKGSTTASSNVGGKSVMCSSPADDEGITVRGGDANQHFRHGSVGTLESNSYVITIRLRGTTESGAVVEQPITTRVKLECPTCGRTSKSSQKFCGHCGTRLLP